MALLTSTIGQLTLTTSAAAADLIEIEVAASGLSRKITKLNLIGATLTGNGTIVTGGFTLTVPKTGTVPVGTGTDGRIAQWSGDANTLAASTLAKTGAGVLTLAAAGAYTLTVPKTGTAIVGTGTDGRVAVFSGDGNTLAAATLAKSGAGLLTLSAAGAYTLTIPATGTAVLLDATQTLTNKTLTTPTIGSFTNAQHNHTNAAGGGTLGTNALDNDAVTNAKLANVATSTLKGRATGGTGDPEDLNAAQVRSILNVEDGADVTDAANVAAAGALMTSGDQSASGVKTFNDNAIFGSNVSADGRIDANSFVTDALNLDDDDVFIIEGVGGGFILMNSAASTVGQNQYAIATFRCAASRFCTALLAGSDVETTTGTLTGTTGTDGKLTVSVNNPGGTNTIYIENRTGAVVPLRVTVMGT